MLFCPRNIPALLQVLTRVTKLLELTKEDLEHFQTVTRTSENRPRAVYPSTALQAGLTPSLVQKMFFFFSANALKCNFRILSASSYRARVWSVFEHVCGGRGVLCCQSL